MQYEDFAAAYNYAKSQGALILGEDDPLKMLRMQYAYTSPALQSWNLDNFVPTPEGRVDFLRRGELPPWGVDGQATEVGEFADE